MYLHSCTNVHEKDLSNDSRRVSQLFFHSSYIEDINLQYYLKRKSSRGAGDGPITVQLNLPRCRPVVPRRREGVVGIVRAGHGADLDAETKFTVGHGGKKMTVSRGGRRTDFDTSGWTFAYPYVAAVCLPCVAVPRRIAGYPLGSW